MHDIYTILKKELLDTIRDKRTVIVMVIMPLVVIPALLGLVTMITKSSIEKEVAKKLKVGYVAEGPDAGLKNMLETPVFNFELIELDDTVGLRGHIPDSLDVGVYIPADFGSKLEGLQTAEVTMFYDQTEDVLGDRVEGTLKAFQEVQQQVRLDSLGLTSSNIHPMEIVKENVASEKQMMGKIAGGFLPYMIILFSFMGCMYTAVDIYAGEKERGSFETILTVPIDRWKILVGKIGVIVIVGMITTTLGFLGLFIGLQFIEAIPESILSVINGLLNPGFILTLMGMLFLLNIFFAGAMTPISLYARNFKEAQSTLAPLNIVVVIPAVLGMLPGFDLNPITAIVPVLNIVLSTKELIAGTMDPGLLAMVVGSLLVLAVVSVWISFKRFGSETNVLRS